MVQVLGGEIKEVPFLDIGGNTMSVNEEECVRDDSTGNGNLSSLPSMFPVQILREGKISRLLMNLAIFIFTF